MHIFKFESLGLSQDEPLWSVNMKKAIASKLQLHVSGSRSLESALRNFDIPSDGPVEDVNAVFQVYEVRKRARLVPISVGSIHLQRRMVSLVNAKQCTKLPHCLMH